MNRGFTLLEVVVALLVLEVAVLAGVGTLALASNVLAEAQQIERAVALAEGVLDSLQALPGPDPGGEGRAGYAGGSVEWSVDEAGAVVLRATDTRGVMQFEVHSRLPPR